MWQACLIASKFVNIISDPITVVNANYAVLEVREVDISDFDIWCIENS